MRIAMIPWLALASSVLITIPTVGTAQRLEEPVWVEPDARLLAASPAVERATEALLDETLEGADTRQLIAAIGRIRADSSFTPAQRDAVLYGYVERLRDYSPGTAPQAVLDWLAEAPPLAVTGHEEGAHHGTALFNVAAAARGLTNEWSWRRGHDAVADTLSLSPSALAKELDQVSAFSPGYRGMRYAISRLPAQQLEALATHCAVMPGGCGAARADIELARGNVRWLETWLTSAASPAVMPRLRRMRQFLPSAEANEVIRAALKHPDKGIAAWALSDLTAHLPKDESQRRQWGGQLVSLLDDPDLGAAAALQLTRMDSADWLEAAATQALGARARARLELLAELETTLGADETESEAKP